MAEKIYYGKASSAKWPKNPHLRLRFDADPLSCIVTLPDVLQDFERPCVEFAADNSDNEKVLAKYKSGGSATKINYNNRTKTLQIVY